ncbi:MAG: hypothetical protein AB1846_16840 [Chloroflexota bacterium]
MKTQYFATSKQKLFYTILGTFFLAFSVLFGYVVVESWFTNAFEAFYRITSPLIFLISVSWTLRCFYRGYYEKITLSERGVEYNTLGYVVDIKWNTAKRLGTNWDGFYKSTGLFASDYSMKKKSWLPNMFKETFIPLSIFSSNWSDSDLGQQIKLYAPHLFA